MVMILADEPHTIVQVNKLWEDMSGYKAEEVVGRSSCRILEGEQSDANAAEVFMDEIRFKRPTSAMILHYKKSSERFKNFFLAYPLSTDSRITHYLIFTSHIGAVSDGSDVSSSITETTVSDTQQQVLNVASPSVAIQSGIAQSNNFLQQNLRANFNAAQRQAELPPNSLQIMTLPPVVSNPVSVVPSASILPPNLPSSSTQNSPDFAPQQQQLQQQQQIQPQIPTQPQQLHINASKRPHESISNCDVGSSMKQPKTNLDIDPSSSSVDPPKLVILSAQTN
jgi:hypothetical protein